MLINTNRRGCVALGTLRVGIFLGLLLSTIVFLPTEVGAAATINEPVSGPLGYFPLAVLYTAIDATVPTGVRQPVAVANLGGTPPVSQTSSVLVNVTIGQSTTAGTVRIGSNDVSSANEPDKSSVIQYPANQNVDAQISTRVATDGSIFVTNVGPAAAHVKVSVVGFYATQQSCFSPCVYHNRFQPAVSTTIYDGRQSLLTYGNSIPLAISSQPGASAATQAVVRVSVLSPPNAHNLGRLINVHAPNQNDSSLVAQFNYNETAAASKIITSSLSNGTLLIDLPASSPNLPNPPSDPDGARAYVMVDLIGWFDAANNYTPATTTALRTGVHLVPGSAGYSVDLRGLDGAPLNGADYGVGMRAVTLNVTARNATKAGYLSLGGGLEHVSFAANQTMSNQVTVPVDTTGTIKVTYAQTDGLSDGSVDIDLSFVGWFEWSSYTAYSTGARFQTQDPAEVFVTTTYREGAGVTRTFPILGAGGVPPTGVSSVALIVHLWGAVGPTSLTVWGDGRPMPLAPQVQAGLYQQSTRLVFADVGPDGKIAFLVGTNQVTVEIRVVGWFTPYVGNGPQANSVSVVGDSITYMSAPSVFDQNVDTNQLNELGIPGYQSHEMRFWADHMGSSHPDTAITNLGTNDAWVGTFDVTAVQTRQEIEKLWASYGNSRCRYAVTINATTTPFASKAAQINTELRGLVTPGDSRYVSHSGLIDWNKFVASTNESVINTDGVHPNTTGQARLAMLYEYALTGQADPALKASVPTSVLPTLITSCP